MFEAKVKFNKSKIVSVSLKHSICPSVSLLCYRGGAQWARVFASQAEGWVFKSLQLQARVITRGPWATSLT